MKRSICKGFWIFQGLLVIALGTTQIHCPPGEPPYDWCGPEPADLVLGVPDSDGFDEGRLSAVLSPPEHIEIRVDEITSEELRYAFEVLCNGTPVGERAGTRTVRDARLVVDVELSSMPNTAEELAACTLKYELPEGLRGSRSLAMLVPAAQLSVWLPKRMHPGEAAAIRLVARRYGLDTPIAGAAVEVSVEQDGTSTSSSLVTDESGRAVLELAPELAGQLHVAVTLEHAGMVEGIEGTIDVIDEAGLLITTDKPIYQPGQKINIRLMALQRPQLTPQSNREILLEIFDGRGNKVAKRELLTNEFGISSMSFGLASSVNPGEYVLRASSETAVQEHRVTVEEYSLPKFAVEFGFDKGSYRPGEQLTGVIFADYFFGQPVAGGAFEARAEMDVDGAWLEVQTISGALDPSGAGTFSITVPTSTSSETRLRFDVEVSDTAGQKVSTSGSAIVSSTPLRVSLVPESWTLAPGVENRLFLLVSDPAGVPRTAECVVTVRGGSPGQSTLRVDGSGSAEILVSPDESSLELTVDTTDTETGTRQSNLFTFPVAMAETSLLLRTDSALYKAESTIEITVVAPAARSVVLVDLVKDGLVIQSTDIPVEDGVGSATMELRGEVGGLVVLDASFSADGQIVRNARALYVEPVRVLELEVEPDRDTYLPGENAIIDFTVLDRERRPVSAALGIQIVDEAVFAISNVKEGLLERHFLLGDDAPAALFEMGLEFETTEPGTGAEAELQRSAELLFATLGDLGDPSQEMSSPAATDLQDRYASVNNAPAARLLSVLSELGCNTGSVGSAAELDAANIVAVDGWGQPWLLETTDSNSITLISAGPDEIHGTPDDWSSTYNVSRGW